MSTFDEVRKAIQDILAPELRGISARLDGIDKRLGMVEGDVKSLRDELKGVRDELKGELHAVEARTTSAIEQAKREILLTVQLADAEQRNAVLARKIGELEQKAPQ